MFVRAIWAIFIPIIFLFTLGVIFGVLKIFKITKNNKFYAFNGIFFILIYMQPSVISNLVSVISCKTIDKVSYIHSDSTFECYTNYHISYSLAIIFPGLVIWMIIIPLIILLNLKDLKHKLYLISTRLKFGFLY